MNQIAGDHRSSPPETSLTEYSHRQTLQTASVKEINKITDLAHRGRLAVANGQAFKFKTSGFKYRNVAWDVKQADHGSNTGLIKRRQLIIKSVQRAALVIPPLRR